MSALLSDHLQAVAGWIGKYRETGGHVPARDVRLLERALEAFAQNARTLEAIWLPSRAGRDQPRGANRGWHPFDEHRAGSTQGDRNERRD